MNFKTVTSEEQNAGIRMLKCHLASDNRGHFVTPREAANMPGQVWSCVSCGCRLIFHTGTHGFSGERCFSSSLRCASSAWE